MPGIKEIRSKIKSVQSTSKITRAMEMVAASKMRKAQDRMKIFRPYASNMRRIAIHLMQGNPEYSHPYLIERKISAVGIILVSTDKGLCGGMNTNISRLVLSKLKEFNKDNIEVYTSAFGQKSLNLLTRIGSNLLSQETQLGDVPDISRLLPVMDVQLKAYMEGKIDSLYVASTRFVNTMRQEPIFSRFLPLSVNLDDPYHKIDKDYTSDNANVYNWDYIYEPDAKSVIDNLLDRYVDCLLYQAIVENMASEQSARMVAMKAASDNAKRVIDDLQMIYNKNRQTAITKEISEIVSGASAV
ncbi:F-type H+-transporting ATPase subunit gamma [Candidatus Kinetoplastibacterium blastocrithidii TCC012E]|uniref:ATP synthase gamma chain n=1 Tax=Candidatus Kinetoplastidibacterium blastocrithidiae TCC012E TaxID=1208922 RepID=M1MCI1_9PROT|nr:F0F1 ATP synthase subunit gamma [Candidatus Kinetoplastibacterium blastocrithidii]AFZ83409.1 F0F1 ATP synthase subunit gamma [Candidatus Kinetoplastibacterium blastocrithidii (ex Strigomonas culicis)]AGF49505.1 F-type H+-transporting ATPase subunit gamma [Candidatus Kinetoplastibacterium blastocrithidii TCC012E]